MKQILCYGDSNTWGLIPGTKNRFPWGIRWTSLLQEKLREESIRILEEGLCGRTTVFEDSYRENRNGWKTLPAILETHSPVDSAIVMLGTNDCKSYYIILQAILIEKCMNGRSADMVTIKDVAEWTGVSIAAVFTESFREKPEIQSLYRYRHHIA